MLMQNLLRCARNGVLVRQLATLRRLPGTRMRALYGTWKMLKPLKRPNGLWKVTAGKSPRAPEAAQEIYLRLEKEGYISAEE